MRVITNAPARLRQAPPMPVSELIRQMDKEERLGFPVIDAYGRLQGVVTLTDIHAAAGKEGADIKTLTVDDISTKSPMTAYPDQTLHEVLLQMGARDLNRIPVVDRDDPTRFVGILRRHDIIRAYVGEISRQSASTQV